MSNNGNIKTLQAQIVAQWITSLAIAVICCAILFIVFAGYIVDLHEAISLQTVRIEVLQERQSQLMSDLIALKRSPLAQVNVPPVTHSADLPGPVEGGEPASGEVAPTAAEPKSLPNAASHTTSQPADKAGEADKTTAAPQKEDSLMPVLNPDAIGDQPVPSKEQGASEKKNVPERAEKGKAKK